MTRPSKAPPTKERADRIRALVAEAGLVMIETSPYRWTIYNAAGVQLLWFDPTQRRTLNLRAWKPVADFRDAIKQAKKLDKEWEDKRAAENRDDD